MEGFVNFFPSELVILGEFNKTSHGVRDGGHRFVVKPNDVKSCVCFYSMIDLLPFYFPNK